MSDHHDNSNEKPAKLTGAAAEAERRRERAAQQLRMNLQRRKAQLRARREGAPDEREDGLLTSGAVKADNTQE